MSTTCKRVCRPTSNVPTPLPNPAVPVLRSRSAVTDLSRLLHLPGTFNRSDERNGHEPVPSELVECHANRRYPLSVSEAFESAASEIARAKQIAAMPLPAHVEQANASLVTRAHPNYYWT